MQFSGGCRINLNTWKNVLLLTEVMYWYACILLNQQPVFMMFSVSHWCVTRLYDIYKLSCYRAAYMAVSFSHVIGFRRCKNVTQYISIVVLSVLIKLLVHLNRPEIHDLTSDLHYLFWWEIFTCGLAYINQIKAYDQLISLRTHIVGPQGKVRIVRVKETATHELSDMEEGHLFFISSFQWCQTRHTWWDGNFVLLAALFWCISAAMLQIQVKYFWYVSYNFRNRMIKELTLHQCDSDSWSF